MDINIKNIKIAVTVPLENVDEIRNSVCNSGAGIIGNYTYCSIAIDCTGTFKPNDKANPFIGENGKLEEVKEKKLEFICDIKKVKKILKTLRNVHPYEEPAIDIIPLLDEEYFK